MSDQPPAMDPVVQKAFDLLGDREPFDVLDETSDQIDDIFASADLAALRKRPAPGKWSANEILGHLIDEEWVVGTRIRFAIAETGSSMAFFDQDAWVAALEHNDKDPIQLAEEFRAVRHFNMQVYEALDDAQLERTSRHSRRGEESIATILCMLAGHDLLHLDQIRRTLKSVQ